MDIPKFVDPMKNSWTVRKLSKGWDIIRIKDNRVEVIAPKITSTFHPAFARLTEMLEVFGWDTLPENKAILESFNAADIKGD